jgi:glycine hydroxymethyltransferase
MKRIAELIDKVLTNHTNETVIGQVKNEINDWMGSVSLFASA